MCPGSGVAVRQAVWALESGIEQRKSVIRNDLFGWLLVSLPIPCWLIRFCTVEWVLLYDGLV
jgi:hypothetical protein